ncbi:MAG: hypothetical protein JKY37_08705 [Nannocystaceae bacterium]|nr:hypothetical protein [Nannocystaceae bacterium]
MLVARLRLVTDLGMFDGYCHPALQELADSLQAMSLCGADGATEVKIEVVTNRLGASLEIDVGPMSMYATELVITTRSGDSFDALLGKTIARLRNTAFSAGLVPVAGQGHREHMASAGKHLDDMEDMEELIDAGEHELDSGSDSKGGHHHGHS